MEKELLEEFWALGLEELKTVMQLYELKGDFINLDCRLPNGQTAKLLDDEKRCYGLAADEGQLVVYEYGNGGADAELVVWKRRG